MFCEVCGAKLDDDSLFCPECGARVAIPEMQAPGRAAVFQEENSSPEEALTGKAPEEISRAAVNPEESAYSAGPDAGQAEQGYQEQAYTEQGYTEPVYTDPSAPMNGQGFDREAFAADPEPQGMNQEKKPFNKKILIFGGAGLFALILLVALGVVFIPKLLGGGGSAGSVKSTKPAIFEVYDSARNYYVAPEADDSLNDFLNEEVMSYYFNLTHTAALLESDDEIWFFDGKDITELADVFDEDNPTYYGFIGLTKDFAFEKDDTLYVYHADTHQSEAISEEGALKNADLVREQVGITSSSDGKYYAYALRSEDGEYKSYIWDGKAVQDLGRSKYVVSIANGGKSMYYVDVSRKTGKRSLVYRKGINSERDTVLDSSESDSIVAVTNADGTELVYVLGSKVYFTERGKEPVKIFSNDDFDLLRSYEESFVPFEQNGVAYAGLTARRVSVESFKNRYYRTEDTLYYMNNKGEMNRVVKHVGPYCYVCSDGKTVYYQDDEYSLCRVNGTKSGAGSEILVDADCYGMVPTADGKIVFFENENDELIALKNGKETTVSTEPNATYGFGGLLNGKTFVYLEDDELCLSSGKKGEAVRGMNQEVSYFVTGNGYIVVNGEDEIFYSTDGKKFSVVYPKD